MLFSWPWMEPEPSSCRSAHPTEEAVSHPNVILYACRPCVDARGLAPSSLDHRVKLGGMNEFHAAAKQPDSKVVAF
jgi:tRNA 2-thiouridine synthesizing protein D